VFEMGIYCSLKPAFSFLYRADVGNNLIEHEFDHVFIGISSEQPVINMEEVSAWRMTPYDNLAIELKQNPERFTEWFRLVAERVALYYKNQADFSDAG
jgi:isopentenyl-diphosphate delta-isomerase